MSPRKKTKPSNPIAARLGVRWAEIILAALLLLGFGLRMVDLTDPPLDFHPTRQFRGAVVARSLYYQLAPSSDPFIQQQAVAMRNSVSDLEPPILESLVAFVYLLVGGEYLWVARILTSLLWVLAGIPLYALARRFVSPAAALLAVAYYLFLPFGVLASRSFQPDPFMVAVLIVTMFAAHRWSETRGWKWALLAAVSSGLAILIKAFAVYFVLGALAALVLYTLGLRAALRDKQVWAMAAICILPAALYYLLSIGGTSGGYVQNWIVALLPLAFEPAFYVRWADMLTDLLGAARLAAAFSGVLIAELRARWLLVGAWAGYAIYGVTLPHQTTTHNYYHLFLVPLAALSIAPIFHLIVKKIAQQARFWQALFVSVLLGSLFFTVWISRSDMLGVDYRDEPPFWQSVGAAIPTDGETIGLVQAYGNLLTYYGWRRVELWPVTGELYLAGLRGNEPGDFETFFLERTAGMDYFLITSFNQADQQPMLIEYLETHYPVFSEGDGYLIYDLNALVSNLHSLVFTYQLPITNNPSPISLL
ncbi:MAG: glycosyltransferase family 39 protein [Anaerolineales bacterium]